MAVTIIDTTTASLAYTALVGADGTREVGIITAVKGAFQENTVTNKVYDENNTLLATFEHAPFTTDFSTTQKKLLLGSQLSYTYHATGIPVKAEFSTTLGLVIFSCTCGYTSDKDIVFAGPIEENVPCTLSGISFYSPVNADTDIVVSSVYWIVEPANSVNILPTGSVDYNDNISSGADRLMFFSNVPTGMDIVNNVLTGKTLGEYDVIIGPDDFGIDLRTDDSNGSDLVGGSSNTIGGVSWTYFNAGTQTRWAVPGGTWKNEDNVNQATTTALETSVTNQGVFEKTFNINVLPIVQRWAEDPRDNYGIILRGTGGGTLVIGTRQTSKAAVLTITYSDATPDAVLTVDVDASMTNGGAAPTGASGSNMSVSNSGLNNAYLYWDLPEGTLTDTIDSATLTLTTVQQAGNATIKMGAFRAIAPFDGIVAIPTATGKVLEWTNGAYSGNDPTVLFGTQFPGIVNSSSNPSWLSEMSFVTTHNWDRARTITATNNGEYGITLPETSEYALRLEFPVGGNLSNDEVYPCSFTYPFAKPENNWVGRDHAFVHYRIIFGNDSAWSDNGKMIGFHGKLDLCDADLVVNYTDGNGGSPASSFGWSARGILSCTAHSLMDGIVRSGGFYAYHQNQAGSYGDRWYTAQYLAGLFKEEVVYDCDMELKINTPGVANGIARFWVNDYLVYENTAVEWRPADVDYRLVHPTLPNSQYPLNIAGAWFAPEYGGTGTIPTGEGGHIVVTDYVVSTERIGKQP